MNLSGFVDEELQRVEEIKKDKTLQAMIQTRDDRISRLQRKLKYWRFMAALFSGTTVALSMLLLK
ncbi:hypothetical protein [Anaerotignum sp.]